jgi:hypothetical protein
MWPGAAAKTASPLEPDRGLKLKEWLPTEPRMKRQRVALTQLQIFPRGVSGPSRQPSRKMDKPDEKKLGMIRDQYISIGL